MLFGELQLLWLRRRIRAVVRDARVLVVAALIVPGIDDDLPGVLDRVLVRDGDHTRRQPYDPGDVPDARRGAAAVAPRDDLRGAGVVGEHGVFVVASIAGVCQVVVWILVDGYSGRWVGTDLRAALQVEGHTAGQISTVVEHHVAATRG